jgi:hypothetical protein
VVAGETLAETQPAPVAAPVGKAGSVARGGKGLSFTEKHRLESLPGYAALFEPPGDPVGPGFINVRIRDDALAAGEAAGEHDRVVAVLADGHRLQPDGGARGIDDPHGRLPVDLGERARRNLDMDGCPGAC